MKSDNTRDRNPATSYFYWNWHLRAIAMCAQKTLT